ncbi:MAG: M48 family metalloprotease, partial [Cytophagales bacterium]|nr:M48 family metalloprotease [Cytophagales bacterium]
MSHPILEYLGKASAVVLVWYVLYRFLLRRQTFFQLNRAFILAVVIWLGVLPLVRIPLYYSTPPVSAAPAMPVLPAVAVVVPSNGGPPAADTPFDWAAGLLYAYVFGVAVCLLRLGWQMFRLWRFRRFFPNRRADGYRLVDTTGSDLPVFSFFNWLFWQENPAWTDAERQHVLAHELAHIRQRHSVDTLLMECMAAAFWFHPAAHLLKAELKT